MLPAPGEFSAAGRVSCIIGPENASTMLYGLLSAVSTANPAAGVYEHTFGVGSTQPSYEMQTERHYHETWERGGIIGQALFSISRSSLLRADMDMTFREQIALTAGTMPGTLLYSTLLPFADTIGILERDDGAVTDIEGFSLRLSCNPQFFKPGGSALLSDAVPGKHEVGWDIIFALSDSTELRRFLGDKTGTNQQGISNTYQSVKVEWDFRNGQEIAVGYPYSLKFTAYGMLYVSFPEALPSDSELLYSRPTGIVSYNATAGQSLQVFLRNSLANSGVVS